jgi:hypothetical protein
MKVYICRPVEPKKWTFVMALLLVSAQAIGQTADTTALTPPDPWRVRAEWPGGRLDSVWLDTLWVWQGPCPDSLMTFRFDRAGEFAMLQWPCEAVPETHLDEPENVSAVSASAPTEVAATDIPPELLAKVLGESDIVTAPSHRAWVRWNRSKSDRLDWALARDGSCFPPVANREFEALDAELEAVLFERERMAVLASFAETRCFSADQTHLLITRVQSEDRRLALLQQILPSCSAPDELDVASLFVMQSMKTKATQLVENMLAD